MAKNKKLKIHPITETPKKRLKSDQYMSVDIILISGKSERRGYYDAHGSVSGSKFFYYRKNSIEDCSDLKNFPTHWYYV